MAFTIEPGIYIRQSALDALPRTPENLAFIEQVQPAVRKYADIGVRIEDSFLLEEAGLRNLSAAVPKTIDAIEAFLRRRRGEVRPWSIDIACGVRLVCAVAGAVRSGSTPATPSPRATSSGRSPARPARSTWSAPFTC